jgi:hypothetical protein
VSPIPVLVTKAVESPLEFKVPITICSRTRQNVATTALIDSGSAGTFIDEQFVQRHGILRRKLTTPLTLRTVDGSTSKAGTVTHYCVLMIRIDQRTLVGKFNITRLGKDDLLLGLPFLSAVKPTIDWENRTITIPSTAESRKLDQDLEQPSTIPPPLLIPLENPQSTYFDVWTDLWSNNASLTPDFLKTSNKAQEFALEKALQAKAKSFEELVPQKFHSFADVFSEEKFSELPPFRPDFDLRIDTVPDYEPQRAKAYQLAEPERKAMNEFIDKELAKGTIISSKSPQASGFFFIGKKDGSLRPCQDY